MEGAQFSPFVLNGILLSAICAALKDSSAINRNGNGSHPEHHAEHVATLTKHLEELQKAEETHARQAPDVSIISSKWLLGRRTFCGVFGYWNTRASSPRGLSGNCA